MGIVEHVLPAPGPRSNREVVIRPPLVGRVSVVVFCTLFAGFTVLAMSSALRDGQWSALVFIVPFVVFPIGFAVFNLRLVVRTRGNELTIRNGFRTHRLTRHEVIGFSELNTGSLVRSIFTTTVDGRNLQLRVTQAGPLGGRRTDERLARLNAWLDATA